MCHACLNILAQLRKIDAERVREEHGQRIAARAAANTPWPDPDDADDPRVHYTGLHE
jgi:hypothetical protein